VLNNLTAPVFENGVGVACDNNSIGTLVALISRERSEA